MSDLQISLVVIGALVIGAVYLYNWLQERRFRRRLGQAFGDAHEDVLLRGAREPVLGGRQRERQARTAAGQALAVSEADDSDAPAAVPTRASVDVGAIPEIPGFDPALDYVAEIEADAPIAEAVVGELTRKISACGKPSQAVGFDAQRAEWEDLGRGAGGRYTKVRLALQLVNRAGPVNVAQLGTFCDAVRSCADKIPALAECPDAQAALEAARDLDAFCAEVDVAVGINVVAEDGVTFSGTRIRSLAEAAGFKLEPDGIFHYRDEQRQTLFTLDNHEPAPFLPEQIKSLTTRGITLLLDVPRVADGLGAFERMLEIAGNFAAALGGKLVDDNRVALSESGIDRIKEQLGAIHAAMEARGIAAGSERALRLFS